MELEAAVRGRRSIRKFRPDPIPRNVLEDLLETARWAPSWGNTQPWEIYMITGEPLEAFRKANVAGMGNGEPLRNDVPMPEKWPEQMKTRYMEVGKAVVTSLGLKREDKEGRKRHQLNMAALFGAPCLIVAPFRRTSSSSMPCWMWAFSCRRLPSRHTTGGWGPASWPAPFTTPITCAGTGRSRGTGVSSWGPPSGTRRVMPPSIVSSVRGPTWRSS